jgi:integrase
MVEQTEEKKFHVKSDKKRFFFPDEWNAMIKEINEKNRIFLELMFNTGARFDEAQHLRPNDFDFDRNNVRLWKTKTRAKKGEKVGSPRTISLSSEFSRKIKRYSNKINPDDYIYSNSIQGANMLIKRACKKAKIKNSDDFSTHNIRKTHGMYLKALGIDMGEICTRLGHDANTYISHYGSADIFSDKDMRQIKELLGDLYMRQRRY